MPKKKITHHFKSMIYFNLLNKWGSIIQNSTLLLLSIIIWLFINLVYVNIYIYIYMCSAFDKIGVCLAATFWPHILFCFASGFYTRFSQHQIRAMLYRSYAYIICKPWRWWDGGGGRECGTRDKEIEHSVILCTVYVKWVLFDAGK